MMIPRVREWSFKVWNSGALRAGEDRIVYSARVWAPSKYFAHINGCEALRVNCAGREDNLWFRVMTSSNFRITTAPIKSAGKDRS